MGNRMSLARCRVTVRSVPQVTESGLRLMSEQEEIVPGQMLRQFREKVEIDNYRQCDLCIFTKIFSSIDFLSDKYYH